MTEKADFFGVINQLLLYCLKSDLNLLLLSILDHNGHLRKPRLFAYSSLYDGWLTQSQAIRDKIHHLVHIKIGQYKAAECVAVALTWMTVNQMD